MDIETKTLLEYYKTEQKTKLLFSAFDILEQGLELPLEDIFDILNDSTDIEIIGTLVECLYARLDQIRQKLIQIFHSTGSERVQLYILTVLSVDHPPEPFGLFVTEYIQFERHREFIRQKVFDDKDALLMGLSQYVEENALNDSEEAVVRDLLMIIPRENIYNPKYRISKLKIYDLYMAIDPEKRRN